MGRHSLHAIDLKSGTSFSNAFNELIIVFLPTITNSFHQQFKQVNWGKTEIKQ